MTNCPGSWQRQRAGLEVQAAVLVPAAFLRAAVGVSIRRVVSATFCLYRQ